MKCSCDSPLRQVSKGSPKLFCENPSCQIGYYDQKTKEFVKIGFWKPKEIDHKISLKVSIK